MSNTVDNDKSNVIAEFFKDSSETAKYVVALNFFQGNFYLDIRVFYLPDGKDEFLATRKGISISVDHLGKLRDALEKVTKRVQGNTR